MAGSTVELAPDNFNTDRLVATNLQLEERVLRWDKNNLSTRVIEVLEETNHVHICRILNYNLFYPYHI